MEDDDMGIPPERPDSLLPYDLWTEDALRQVVVSAVRFVSKNGMPGEHHFYISFLTAAAGVTIPARLLAQYPNEMTIVLQHQFWDLKLDEADQRISVGLSFGGIASTLVIPIAALTGFADPHVQFGLRFRPPAETAANDETEAPPEAPADDAPVEPQVVSLDAFRKRSPSKEP